MAAPMEDLLRLVVEENASDLHLTVGAPPALRIRGHLTKLGMSPIGAEDATVLARAIASDSQMQQVNETGSVDFAFSFKEDRFRVSIYRQKQVLGLALRLIPRRMGAGIAGRADGGMCEGRQLAIYNPLYLIGWGICAKRRGAVRTFAGSTRSASSPCSCSRKPTG